MISIRFLSWLTRLIVTLTGDTLRIKNTGNIPENRVIYAFWHSDFFPLVYTNRHKDGNVLVSTHRDGEYLSRVLTPLGYNIIRGSSDEGGARGALQILKSTQGDIGIAPDGPKGPARYVKEGVLRLARLTGLPIIPVGVSMKNPITLGSWDNFKVPMLFSRCTIYWGQPIRIKTCTEETRTQVEKALIEANKRAKRRIAFGS
jgi:lysophospholipid acyltransferase (LPLAT)-like uncharacterized protein